jgi:hypothetical protein
MSLLPQPLKCWDCRHASSCSASYSFLSGYGLHTVHVCETLGYPVQGPCGASCWELQQGDYCSGLRLGLPLWVLGTCHGSAQGQAGALGLYAVRIPCLINCGLHKREQGAISGFHE